MSNNSLSKSDKQSFSSIENVQFNFEIMDEKAVNNPSTELNSSSLGSYSDNSNSAATVFRLKKEKIRVGKSVVDIKPDFQIGGVLSSRNTSKHEDNAHYLFKSKNYDHLKQDQELYKSLPGPVPPINLANCVPSVDLAENVVSPTAISVSSLTSNRKLEWDSGADVGYLKKYNQSDSLCTLERMALGNSASFLDWADEYGPKQWQTVQPTKDTDVSNIYSNKSLFTETDDTYCDSSDAKIILPRRKVPIKQKFSKAHKTTSPKRKHKPLERPRGKAYPFSTKTMMPEDMHRCIRPTRHFGGCCHPNRDSGGKIANSSSHLHSTPLCSSVSSGSSETLKANVFQSAPCKMNFPSFDTTISSSSISQHSYNKLRTLAPTVAMSIDGRSPSLSSSVSKSTSRENTLDATLSAINSSLKDLSEKLRQQAEYLAGCHSDVDSKKFEKIFHWIEFIGTPASDGSDILFRQTLAEKVIKLLTKISKTEQQSGTYKCVKDDASSASIVLEDIGQLSRKFGHQNKETFFEEVKERCTTPGGTVICVPYRPPASSKTYYITVNEDLLFLQENDPAKLSKSLDPLKVGSPTRQSGENAKECLMMVRRVSGENIFSETNVELSSDQSLHLHRESLTLDTDMSSDVGYISRSNLKLFGRSPSASDSESTYKPQSLQETIASSFEFYSPSSTEANLTTIEECTRINPPQQDTIAEEKKQKLGDSETTEGTDKESREKAHRGRKNRSYYEKNALKCIKALEKIEKKLQLSHHSSFSDNASLRADRHSSGRKKFYSSDGSSIDACIATTVSNTTTDNEGTFVRRASPPKTENNLKSDLADFRGNNEYAASVRATYPAENLTQLSELANLKKLLASTNLPGEPRAHRFLLRDGDSRMSDNLAAVVDTDAGPNTAELTLSSAATTTGKDPSYFRAFGASVAGDYIEDGSSSSDSMKLDASSRQLCIRKDNILPSDMSSSVSGGNGNFKSKNSSAISKLLGSDEAIDISLSSDLSNSASVNLKPSVPFSSGSSKLSLSTNINARRMGRNQSTDVSSSISMDDVNVGVQISSKSSKPSGSGDKNSKLSDVILSTNTFSSVSLSNVNPRGQISSESSKFSISNRKNTGTKRATLIPSDNSSSFSVEHVVHPERGDKICPRKSSQEAVDRRLPFSEISTTQTDDQRNSKEVDVPIVSGMHVSGSHSTPSARSIQQPIGAVSMSDELSNIEENLQRLRLRCKSLKGATDRRGIEQGNKAKLTNNAVMNDCTKRKQAGATSVESRARGALADTKRKMDNAKFNKAVELVQLNKENGMSLKEALYVAKPSYVIDAECRRTKILRKAKLRQELQSYNHSVLARLPESLKTPSTLQGFLVKNQESPLFKYKAMIAQNKRLVQLLPETSEKEAANKKIAHSTTNRLMGRLYSRKLKRKVLGGKVSHGHKLVVSPLS